MAKDFDAIISEIHATDSVEKGAAMALSAVVNVLDMTHHHNPASMASTLAQVHEVLPRLASAIAHRLVRKDEAATDDVGETEPVQPQADTAPQSDTLGKSIEQDGSGRGIIE